MPPITTPAGYWGPVTASVDWCEENYATSIYIAEFYNTISSLAIVGSGLAGFMSDCPRKFKAAFLCTIIVGLGSIMFHLTLRKEWQASDEVPMLYCALSYLYIIMSQDGRLKGAELPVAVGMVCYAAVTTWAVVFTQGALQFLLFHWSFGPIELYCLYRIYQKGGRLASYGFTAYVLGIGFWFLDFYACHFQMYHAFWHVFASLGMYYLSVALLQSELQDAFKNKKRM